MKWGVCVCGGGGGGGGGGWGGGGDGRKAMVQIKLTSLGHCLDKIQIHN